MFNNRANKGKERRVMQFDKNKNLVNIFKSLSEAGIYTNINFKAISNCCLRKSKVSGGFIFCYEDEYDENYINEIAEHLKHTTNNGRLIGEKHRGARKIICINTKEIFNTIKEASKRYNIGCPHISSCCNKKRKTTGKHLVTGEQLKWMYYEDYIKQQEQIHNENNNNVNKENTYNQAS
jgi:hypothetical protein